VDNFENDIAAVGRVDAVSTILDVVCRTTGMGFAAVARVTGGRWIACSVKDDIAFGLKPGGELKVESTICHEIRQNRTPVIIDHVAEDALYRDHHTPAQYGFQSYISMPIILPDGSFFGTLCAIDPRPARLNTPEVVGMFTLFAELIAFHLDALDRIDAVEVGLADARTTAALREQFIAVLGHDLRNPVAAVGAGMEALRREPLTPKGERIVDLVQKSVGRMSALIDDVLDFARGRLGGGIPVMRKGGEPLAEQLELVVAELSAAHPQRTIATAFDLRVPIDCDRGRIGQLLSNLVGNALMHGRADRPISVHGAVENGEFVVSVANAGDPIPPEAMERLFAPFARGEVRPHQQGLGLGLYIASEIARAHGGRIGVTSTPEETRFTFRMPLN
jgi:signal transduction histidine kinase